MGGCCDLQVDVNGEEVFMVDKKILAAYSGRFRRLFGKLTGASRCLKVIFHDFPGGAEGFELMARFCYNNGRIEITPSNIVLLFCVAHFMEMGGDGDGSGRPNILSQTEKSLEGISFWTWSNLVVALKQCQDLLPALNSSSILPKLLDSIIAKLFSPYVTSTYASSSEDLSFQFSSGRSSYSLKTDCSRKTWWVEDLLFLNTDLLEKVVRRMIFQELDHTTIFKFLFHYHQYKSIGAARGEKRKITELVIGLLFLLDRSFLSVKGLFKIYQAAVCLRVSKKCLNKLVSLVGSQLDQATIDFLLVPSPRTKKYVYDVSLVLKLVKSFLLEGGDRVSHSRLKSVAKLVDSYLAEVAPDSHLNPSKFEALATMLPHSARESHDRLYQAIDVYFTRRTDLFREEKMSICCALNYEKLSTEALKHLAHNNSKFPPRKAVEAFATEQLKLRSLFHEAYNLKTLDSLFIDTGKEIRDEKDESKQIIPLSTKKLDLPTETRKRRADLQSMQWKASELGVCGTMEMKMTGARNLRLSFRGSTRYLPTLFP